MTDDIVFGALSPDDGYADPTDVTMAVIAAARRRGVQVRVGTKVTGIATTTGGRSGFGRTTATSRARWWWMRRGWTPRRSVLTSARRSRSPHTASTNSSPSRWAGFRDEIPCTQDAGLDLYIKKEGDGLLLGVASPSEAGSRSREVNWKLAEDLADKISHRWPSLEQAGLAHAWAGPYEVTPDGLPCIGQLKDPSGFVYAAGFNGHGFHARSCGRRSRGRARAERLHFQHQPHPLRPGPIRSLISDLMSRVGTSTSLTNLDRGSCDDAVKSPYTSGAGCHARDARDQEVIRVARRPQRGRSRCPHRRGSRGDRSKRVGQDHAPAVHQPARGSR